MIRSLIRTQARSNAVRILSCAHISHPLGQIRFVSGLQKEMHVSTQLANILGESTASRANITKGLWAYIKSQDLQVPDNRRYIDCGHLLKAVFVKDRIHMMEIAKLVQPHILHPVE